MAKKTKKTEEITTQAPETMTIRSLLAGRKAQLEQVVPKHLTVERLLMVAMTTISKTPKLGECSTASLLKAVMDAGQAGLEPDGRLAYLIPRWNSKSNCMEAHFQIGYQGQMQIARRAGDMKFSSQVVYKNDKFDLAYGLNERLEHIPFAGERGEMIAVYAIAKFKDGDYAFDVMFRNEVEKIKAEVMSKSKTYYGPWKDHEGEMWKKTVLKRLCKLLPESIEMQTATAIDDQNNMPIPEEIIEVKTNEQADNLKQKLAEMKEVDAPPPDAPQEEETLPAEPAEPAEESAGEIRPMHMAQKDYLQKKLFRVVDEEDQARIKMLVNNQKATFNEAGKLMTELNGNYKEQLKMNDRTEG